MASATALAVFLGVMTALLGRLRLPIVSSVWAALVICSLGLWAIGLSLDPSLSMGVLNGFTLHFVYGFTFVVSAFALEQALEAASRNRSY